MVDVVQSLRDDVKLKRVVRQKKLDELDESVVRTTIHNMYSKAEPVTMPKLHAVLEEKDIHISLSTVKRTFKRLGFRKIILVYS